MSGMVGLGFVSRLALRNPRVAGFLKRFGKWIALALIIAAGVWAFTAWQSNVKETAYNSGFGAAETKYKAEVEKANLIAQNDQKTMDQMFTYFGGLANQRTQAIQLTVAPQIERIKNEVASNPVYRTCTLTDGVFDDLQAERASVNAGIGASDPGGARR